jgi:hypothetical protein
MYSQPLAFSNCPFEQMELQGNQSNWAKIFDYWDVLEDAIRLGFSPRLNRCR